ncbi:MAG: peptidoglycan-binding protein [Desulfosarcina sp.]|nr:peptidoglycan-binding protein [Desulfosarcina sp.]
MKNTLKVLCLCMGLLLVSSCVKMDSLVSPVAGPEKHQPATTFMTKHPSDLEAVSKLAIELTQMVKKGVLPVAPYMNLNPSGVDLENIAGYRNFFIQNIMILDAGLDSEGLFSQRMVFEALDRMGRIDIRDDRIAFKVRDPNPEEASKIANDIHKGLSKAKLKQLSKAEKAAFKEGIKAYQQDNGLKPDGIFGENTAEYMGKQATVIDVQEITSRIVYPSTPRHAAYIIPLAVVEQNPDQFYNGFDSLEMVKQNSIGPESFAGLAKKGACFVAFVYFFDRVDPQRPLSIRLSKYKQKAKGSVGQKWHAAPGKWPVVVETFTLDKVPGASLKNLFLNVFIEDGKSSRCISSHQIQ